MIKCVKTRYFQMFVDYKSFAPEDELPDVEGVVVRLAFIQAIGSFQNTKLFSTAKVSAWILDSCLHLLPKPFSKPHNCLQSQNSQRKGPCEQFHIHLNFAHLHQ